MRQIEAELLLAYVLRKPREWVLAHPEAKVCKYASMQVCKLFKRRAQGVPVAYLTGHKEFFGLDFEVNKNVLIPRPDTEALVEAVLAQLSTLQLYNFTTCLIDVGTGSGNIPIAIAHNIRKSGLSGNLDSIIAIDISAKALSVAKRNAKKHGVKIKFAQGDLLEPFIKSYNPKPISCNLIITANLPYLSEKQYKDSPTIQFEPKTALIAKNSGLALYEKLLTQIKQVTGYRLKVTGFFEIDPSQSSQLTKLIKSILPTAKIEIIKDLSGLDRVVKITAKGL